MEHYQLLAYAYGVTMFSEDINIVKKNTSSHMEVGPRSKHREN
jgi:hypothetical protein